MKEVKTPLFSPLKVDLLERAFGNHESPPSLLLDYGRDYGCVKNDVSKLSFLDVLYLWHDIQNYRLSRLRNG